MTVGAAPLVSVLVTARDNERHVGAALKSVLRQTLQRFELHVIDDGSQDATPDIVSSLSDDRLSLQRFARSAGISARRNQLLERVEGRYVAPLDADDVWFPRRLENHVQLLEKRPDLVAVGSDVLVIDENIALGPYFRLPRCDVAIRWCCLFTSPVIHSASTIRASAFLDGVRYDEAYPLAQDYDLWTKLLRYGRVRNVAAPLTLYRVHPTQATARRAPERQAEQEAIGCRAIAEIGAGIGLTSDRTRLAWSLGAGKAVGEEEAEDALDAYLELFHAFVAAHRRSEGLAEVRRTAATALLRRAGRATDGSAWSVRRAALGIDPGVAVMAAIIKLENLVAARRYRGPTGRLLTDLREV